MRVWIFLAVSFAGFVAYGEAIRCWRRQFACANGNQCIPASRFCDGTANCRDRSDEIRPWKKSGGLRCRKGRRTCFLGESYKNRRNIFCDAPQKQRRCRPNEFKCSDGSKCVKATAFCDGKKDCQDGSDELKRGSTYNITEDRPCKIGSNVCVLPQQLRSKRDNICEKDHICWKDEFKCNGENKCIPWHWFCDGSADCRDGSDETALPSELPGISCHRPRHSCLLPEAYSADLFCQKSIQCLPSEFKCLDGTQCVPANRFCTGYSECRDGSDELSIHARASGKFCRRGRNVCILPEENLEASESYCVKDPECTADEFACLDGTQCVPWRQFCDGLHACRDESDEINFNSSIPGVQCRRRDHLCILPQQYAHMQEEFCDDIDPECNEDEFKCLNNAQCIPNTEFCNGIYDCQDLSDEIMPSDTKDGIPCRNDRLTCLLPGARSSLQEELCEKDTACMSGFRCADGTQCIPKEWFCDDIVQCRDGSDEISVGGRFKTSTGGIQCHVGRSICLLPAEQAFKRNMICSREIDLQCGPNEFKCRDGSECLKASWYCDGESYCRDNSDAVVTEARPMSPGDIKCRYDEYICVLPQEQVWKKDALCKKGAECNEDEFACLDGSRCLERRHFCDGYSDCSDGSDEISPNSETAGVLCWGNRNSWIYFGGESETGGNICILPEKQEFKKKWLCINSSPLKSDL